MLVQDWTAFFRLGCINLSGLTPVSFHYDFSYGIVHMDLHSSFDKINYFLFQFFSQILLILHSKHFFGWKPVIFKFETVLQALKYSVSWIMLLPTTVF